MNDPAIRLAVEADLPFIPAIEDSAAETFVGLEHLFSGEIESSASLERWRVMQQAGTLWVLDAPGEGPMGFLAATRHGERLHIEEFDLVAEWQGRGLGRRLLARVIDWARADGLRTLSLTTFRSVPWNAPFYASIGFREPDDPGPELAAILANEAVRGLRDRCAMVLAL